MFFIALVVSSIFLGLTHCTDVYITSPYNIIVWNLGKQETVTWNILPGGPVIGAFNVDLMDGDERSANVVSNIASGLPITSTSATWTVPNTLAPGNHYFVRVSSPDLALQRFSHRFSIEGTQCSTKTTPSSASSSMTSPSTKMSQSTMTSITTSTTTGTQSDSTVTRTVSKNHAMPLYQSASSNFVLAVVSIIVLIVMAH